MEDGQEHKEGEITLPLSILPNADFLNKNDYKTGIRTKIGKQTNR